MVVPDPFMASGSKRREDPRRVLDTLASVGYPPLEWYRVGRGIGQVRDKGAHLMLPGRGRRFRWRGARGPVLTLPVTRPSSSM